MQFAVVSSQEDLAEVGRASFGRDRPHYVGEVFSPELLGRLECREMCVDVAEAALGLHPGVALCAREKWGALKTDRCLAAAIAVVDCGRRVADNRDAIDRNVGLSGRALLLARIRRLG